MEKKKQTIHFIGIGGIGVSALARYWLTQGAEVSGSDAAENKIIEELRKMGTKILIGHDKENLDSYFHGNDRILDLVIYSAAVPENNSELVEARQRGIKCQKYAEALGELTKKKFTIAVSGMHGKSTTAAMIGLIMEKAGLDPTVIVGTRLREWGNNNFRAGKSQYLVIEADEYDRSFLNYWPKVLVLLNIEEEHLDTYTGGWLDIMETFGKYVLHLPEDGVLVANEEDENISTLINPKSEFLISKQIPNSKFKIKKYKSNPVKNLNLKIPGEHNLGNANAALAVARVLSLDEKIAIEALNNFNGTWRRMEYKGEINGAKIYDDYGHHPTEIKATLAGGRELLTVYHKPPAKLWCVFQPHQYQRTYELFDKFVNAFAAADKLILLPVYSVAGREKEEVKKKVNSEKLANAIIGQEVIYLDSFAKAAKLLKNKLQKGDIALIMGAGDIYLLTEQLFK